MIINANPAILVRRCYVRPRAGPPEARRGTPVRQDRRVATRIIDGREALDRAGIVARTGAAGTTVSKWLAGRSSNGFPTPISGTAWFDTEAVDAWLAQQDAAKQARLTTVNRVGDPDELVMAPEAARILGYQDSRSLSNSSVWPKLLAAVDETTPLPSGGTRRKWKRRTVWQIGEQRQNRAGRPPTANSPNRGPIDRGGDPDEHVGTTEAARVLGYSDYRQLQNSAEWATLLTRTDQQQARPGGGSRPQWTRRTLWQIADERQPPNPAGPAPTTGPRIIDRTGNPDELVGAVEAARVLGYRHYQSLPAALLELADETTPLANDRVRRRFTRRTLWAFADAAGSNE